MKTKKKPAKVVSVAEHNFPKDAYKPLCYIQYNDEYNAQIMKIIQKDHVRYKTNLKSQKQGNTHLYNYIMECTKHLPENQFRFSIRVFYVLHKWQDFPICELNGCDIRLILDNTNQSFRIKLDKDGNLIYNWPKHCCYTHAQLDPITRQHFIDTCKERYDGAINVFQVPAVKEKSKESLFEHFNVDHPMHSEEIKNKLGDTVEATYGEGIRCVFQLPEVKATNSTPEAKKKRRESSIKTNMKNHGVPWYVMSDEFAKKVNSTGGTSKEEKELVAFIKTLTNDEIIQNSFRIISPKQLDIYIPVKKLAFEFNGTYYHSIEHMNIVDKVNLDYHLQKTKLCEELGIKLIHIWEDEWQFEHEKTLQLIANIINDKITFDTTADMLVLDRSKFNKCQKIDGYELVEETAPEIVVRAKAEKDKYKVPDCGKLVFRKTV